jgi:hypothetical protein
MNTVYVLVALVYSGHLVNTVVPTMEFSTREKCEAAIVAFERDAEGKTGSARMRCVRIEK